jgi:hypothetical protein
MNHNPATFDVDPNNTKFHSYRDDDHLPFMHPVYALCAKNTKNGCGNKTTVADNGKMGAKYVRIHG